MEALKSLNVKQQPKYLFLKIKCIHSKEFMLSNLQHLARLAYCVFSNIKKLSKDYTAKKTFPISYALAMIQLVFSKVVLFSNS